MKGTAHVEPAPAGAGLHAHAAKLSAIVQRCPACHKPWTKHRVALIASRLLGVNQLKATEEVFRAVKGHHWEVLEELHDRSDVRNSLEAYALGCPDHRLHILVVRSPFELHVGNEMLICEPVSETERPKIEALIAENSRMHS
jgi:hypothetical protein